MGDKVRKVVFGRTVSIPEDMPVYFEVSWEHTGRRYENWSHEYGYFNAVLKTDGKLEILGSCSLYTVNYVHAGEKIEKLYDILHKGGFNEEKKAELSAFLLDEYEKGKVTMDAALAKFLNILGVRAA